MGLDDPAVTQPQPAPPQRVPQSPLGWSRYARWSLASTVLWLLLASAHLQPFAATVGCAAVVLPLTLSPARRWQWEVTRTLSRIGWMVVSLIVVWLRHPGFASRWYLRSSEPVYMAGHLVPTMYEFVVEVLHLEVPGLVVIEIVAVLVAWVLRRRRRLYGPLGSKI